MISQGLFDVPVGFSKGMLALALFPSLTGGRAPARCSRRNLPFTHLTAQAPYGPDCPLFLVLAQAVPSAQNALHLCTCHLKAQGFPLQRGHFQIMVSSSADAAGPGSAL